jgi:hypothetical protein
MQGNMNSTKILQAWFETTGWELLVYHIIWKHVFDWSQLTWIQLKFCKPDCECSNLSSINTDGTQCRCCQVIKWKFHSVFFEGILKTFFSGIKCNLKKCVFTFLKSLSDRDTFEIKWSICKEDWFQIDCRLYFQLSLLNWNHCLLTKIYQRTRILKLPSIINKLNNWTIMHYYNGGTVLWTHR